MVPTGNKAKHLASVNHTTKQFIIQSQKRYPTSLDKISILTQRLLVLSREKMFCEINSLRTYLLLAKYLISVTGAFLKYISEQTTIQLQNQINFELFFKTGCFSFGNILSRETDRKC